MSAESIGAFLNVYVKPTYASSRVDEKVARDPHR